MVEWQTSEQLFEARLGLSGKKVFVNRVTDTAEVRGRNNGKGYVKAQASDYIVTENGEMYYAEVKSVKGERFPFSNIAEGQLNAAIRQTTAGGKYFFYIHMRKLGRWFKLPAQEVIGRVKRSMNLGELLPFEWSL